jgi:exodeoxyribonuclease V alpha subunit
MTRELLYTAVTRARERVEVWGEAEQLRAAVERPLVRSSGLRDALWGTRGATCL